MRSSLLDYAFSVLAFYKTAAGLRVKCAKFQPDWSTYSCVMVDFAKCAKLRRKKMKKFKQNLFTRISEMAGSLFFKFGM